MKNMLLLLLLLVPVMMKAQEVSIIPKPDKIQLNKGSFILSKSTVIVISQPKDSLAANFLNHYLQQFYALKLKLVNKKPASNYIALTAWHEPVFSKAAEAYQLIVDKKFIAINANTHAGNFYGIQTLIQLLPAEKATNNIAAKTLHLPAVVIEDGPRFSYRGIHLDVCRHFFPVSFIKQYIDYLALHKFNTFHWHLTDDQGWRIEIKHHPRLTTVGAWRNGTIIGRYPGKGNDSLHYGGFYTQEEIKEVVKYASDRFITVIPEIEMPGHASAAIAAYPELSCFPQEDTRIAKGTSWAGPSNGKQVQQAWGVFEDIFCAGKEHTFQFLETVLDEVITLFPSKYIHIGGDEAPKTHWKRCSLCQQKIKELGLKDEHELQSYFIQRIEKYLNSRGKQIIGWDEILEGGLAPNATVMSWQGEKGGIEAAKQNHDVVMTPGNWCYFDHAQSKNEDSVTIGGFTPLDEVYSYNPVPKQLNETEARHILGAQANMWTEYQKNTRKIEYQLFPRIAAMSEVLWTQESKRDSADFEMRLLQQFKRYDRWKVNYSKAFYELTSSIMPAPDYNGLMYSLQSKYKDAAITITTNNSTSTVAYTQPVLIDSSVTLAATLHDRSNNTLLSHLYQQINFNKATGKKITTSIPPAAAYPGNGGAFGLVNGVTADKFNSTEWLGWNGKPLEITIDFKQAEMVHEIVLNVWEQQPSWIYLPQRVELIFQYSDGSNLSQTTSMEFEQPEEGWGENRKLQFSFEPKMVTAVGIKLTPVMSIPKDRQGAGKPAWIFLDEIEIN